LLVAGASQNSAGERAGGKDKTRRRMKSSRKGRLLGDDQPRARLNDYTSKLTDVLCCDIILELILVSL
jgi:hypothetical protein